MFSLSCALLGGAFAIGSDETSLMQGLKPVQDVKRRHDNNAVANLLESAKGMLKNGETPDVITFAQATLSEITASVLPAIRDASLQEQRLLDAHFELFNAALTALEADNMLIYDLNSETRTARDEHMSCRRDAHGMCYDYKRPCDYQLYALWETFVEQESELREIERRISGHFCATDDLIPWGEPGYWTANGTLHTFRELSPPMMRAFELQYGRVVNAENIYDAFVPFCESNYTRLRDKTGQCDFHQDRLEDLSCQLATTINTVRSEFNCAWQNAVITYTATEAHVRVMEIDRIREWRHLSTVECLLNRTSERNGRECEEATDEATLEIASCEAEWRSEEVRTEIAEWRLTFPCEARMCADGSTTGKGPHLNDDGSTNPGCTGALVCPAYPPNCPDRDSVTGRCYPQHVHIPCTAAFLAEEYAALPEVPQSPFFNPETHSSLLNQHLDDTGNSHCFPRAECQTCTLPDEEECTVVHPPVTIAPVTAAPVTTTATTTVPPAPVCGALPTLNNAVWDPSIEDLLQYRCEEGYSFSGLSGFDEVRLVVCLPQGRHSVVRVCLPINDCVGHTCGAFGACVDQHMDYTCDCVDGFEMTTTSDHEKMCGNVDDCQGHSCGMGGVCEDLIEDYNCNCNEGWEQHVSSDGTKSCERKECINVPQVDNVMSAGAQVAIFQGSGQGSGGKAVFGNTIEYDCLSGYSITGLLDGENTFTITCQANTEFSAVQQCLPISCGEPENFGSSQPVSSAALVFGQTVNYECPTGHGPESFERTCQANGLLSPAIACEPHHCGNPLLFVKATVAHPRHSFFYGQTAEYTCIDGYSTVATDTAATAFSVECLATGWETDVAGCRPVTCDFQPDETHSASAAVPLEFDGVAIIACADGHTVDGSAGGATEHFATCAADGSHDIPSCMLVTCPASSLPIALHAAQVESRNYRLGERATYNCDQGYEVALTSTNTFEVECLRLGSFSSMSTCRNIDDCAGHSCGSNGQCVDGLGDYSCSCEDGFEETVSDSGEKICGNINDCGPSACGSNGACHDLTNGYECECQTGYAVPTSSSADDRVCLPVECTIPESSSISPAPASLHFPESLFLECATGHAIGGQQVSGLQYVGCFTDDGSRDLQDGPRRYGFTSETCRDECSAYPFFALQNNGWCVCGNAYGTESQYVQVADNQCGANCAGDDQPCGSGWRNAVYSTNSWTSQETSFQVDCGANGALTSSDSASLPQCNPVICGRHPALAFAQDMPQQGAEHDYIFGEEARYRCQGGEVEVSFECQADGQFHATSQFNSCQQSCGSPSVPTHGHRLGGAGDVVHPSSVEWACESGFTYLASGEALESSTTYLGCFIDDNNRDLQDGPKQYGYTSHSCAGACSDYNGVHYSFFALQNNGWCVCGNAYSTESQYSQVDDSQCGGSCAGDDQLCGAGWRNAVYSTGLTVSASQVCQANGAFEALSSDIATDAEGNGACVPVSCQRPDAPANWAWLSPAAASFDSQTNHLLMCSHGYQNAAGLVGPSTMVEIRCGRHSTEYVGCYVDDNNRDLQDGPQTYGHDSVSCAAACSDYNGVHYSFFALQNNGWCVCGNAYSTSAAYSLVDSSQCGGNCAGDDQLCGAGWRNAVYRTGGGSSGHSALPSACTPITYLLSGSIRSALPNGAGVLYPISGVSVTIAGQTALTNANGQYEISVPTGANSYTASVAGFIDRHGTVTISTHMSGYDLNMSPVLGNDDYRMVLEWGVFPNDLDSHLSFVGDESRCPRMDYTNMEASCGGVDASLDVDDYHNGEGPETTSLYHINSCDSDGGFWGFRARTCSKWVYRVHNYAGRYDNMNGWAESAAVVMLYNGDHLVGQYNVARATEKQYVGCFVDDGNRDLQEGPQTYIAPTGARYDSVSCAGACGDYNGVHYSFFALQNDGWCVCGNAYSTESQYSQVDDSQCGGTCATDDQLCGAGWRNAVYRTNTDDPDKVDNGHVTDNGAGSSGNVYDKYWSVFSISSTGEVETCTNKGCT